MAPHWPRPWGLGADPTHQLIVDEELRRAGVRRPDNTIGIGWAGPTLVHAGSPAQKDRYLFPLLAGEEIWCQLFSEPGAGSDLASLTTRAELDGDEWVVRGHKVWTSLRPHGPVRHPAGPHRAGRRRPSGDLVLHLPDGRAGVTVSPLIDMTGTHTFNEVFLDDVRLPADSLVGRRGQGWGLAKVTLGNERVSLSGSGALWGMGPTAEDLLADSGAGRRLAGPVTPTATWPGCGARARSFGCSGSAPCRRPWPASSPAPRRRCARRWPTSTASTSWGWPATWPGRGACSRAAGHLGVGRAG